MLPASAEKGEGEVSANLRVMREPMAKVDTAWLRMDSPTNLMMITGVLVFDVKLGLSTLRRLVERRFLAFRRFRQRAVDSGTAAFWETVARPDLRWHVRAVRLPRPADQRALERLVSELASTPLDPTRPLWQFHLVENYRAGSALVARIHHCYADGLALVQVLLSLTDSDPSARASMEHGRSSEGGVMDRLLRPARAGIRGVARLGEKALDVGRRWLAEPALVAALARESSVITRELAHVLSLADDPPTPLKGLLGASKRCAWAEPLPLADVKAIGRVLRCTVNDVLLACAAGALRAYLRERGANPDGLTIRATVPVNLRPLEQARNLGNHFGLVFLDLPIGEPNPLRRLERVATAMRALKQSRQAALTFGLLAAIGMAPVTLQRLALELFSRKATIVATNVPGPQKPLYLAGCRLREIMFWVPQNGSIGVGLSILSYDGRVHFGLIADGCRVADPHAIVHQFVRELEKLTLITLMEDWQDAIDAADAEATLRRFVDPG
jgi:diacylglycerol O-acyltransferase